VNNPGFYSRVGSVPGGLELFMSAGFWLEIEDFEQYLKYVGEVVTVEGDAIIRHVCERLIEFQV
jgi:hypothetical protein